MKIYIRNPPITTPPPRGNKEAFAAYLRANMSGPQEKMWRYLRTRPHGLVFSSEVVLLGWIVDFYCDRYRLVIEVDGKQHQTNQGYDQYRDTTLNKYGYRIWRFTAYKVGTGEAIEDLDQRLSDMSHTKPVGAPALKRFTKPLHRRWTARPKYRKIKKG